MKNKFIGRCTAFIMAAMLAFSSMPITVYAEDAQEIAQELGDNNENGETADNSVSDNSVSNNSISDNSISDNSISGNCVEEVATVSDNFIEEVQEEYYENTEEYYYEGDYTSTYEYEGAGVELDPLFNVPYVSTYYFNPKPTTNDNIEIPIYMTDAAQSEYLDNNESARVDLIYEVDGVSITISNLKLGDYTLTIGKLSEGKHTFSVQVYDKTTGMKSHVLYNDLWVVNPNNYNITAKQTYKMTEADLITYKINNNNSDNITDCNNTRDGLTKLFADKQKEGIRKIVLLPGTYRINGQGEDYTKASYIDMPSNFTVDMNGSTFKLDTVTSKEVRVSACIVRFHECVDSHLINGTIEGDRFERMDAGLETGYVGEMIMSIVMEGNKYCSLDNLEIKNTTGHTVGCGCVWGPRLMLTSYSKIFIDENGKEIAKSNCSTSEMKELTEIIKWDANEDYIYVGHPEGYRGIMGDSQIIYVSFYDSNQKFIKQVTGYQYRKILIPTGAKYARVTLLGTNIATTGYDGTVSIYTKHFENYSEIVNCDFIDTRTTCMAPSAAQSLLIENCTYTRCANSITPLCVDFEDGAQECQDMYYRNNKVIENGQGTTCTVVSCFGYNHVIEENINHSVEIRSKVVGGVIRNMDANSVTWFIGDTMHSGFGRFYNCNTGNIMMYDGSGNNEASRLAVKECVINADWVQTVPDKVVFDKCTFIKLKGGQNTLRNCLIKSAEYIGHKMYLYNCTFEKDDDSTNYITFISDGDDGSDRLFDNCKFKGKTQLNGKNCFHSGTFRGCTFDDVSIVASCDSKTIQSLLFEDCKLNSTADIFLQIGPFAYSSDYINVTFDNCDITHTGGKLIYLYAKPGKNSQILFEKCNINKTSGSLVSWENGNNLTNLMDKISLDITFKDTEVDRTLSVDKSVDSNHARVMFVDGMDVKVKGYTITLNGQIVVNYYIELPDTIRNNKSATVHFSLPNGDSYDIKTSDGVKATNYSNTYIFSCCVPAAYMTTEVSAQIRIPESGTTKAKSSQVFKYSVKEYADYILANSNSYKSSEVEMVKAMLNYGGYAQQYFGIRKGEMANSSLYTSANDPVLSFNKDLSNQQISGLATKGDLVFYGASLVCKDETSLKLYFGSKSGANLQGGRYSVKASYGGKSCTCSGTISNNMYVVTLTGIAAAELDNTYQFTITDTTSASGTFSFSYSPMNYIANAQKSSDIALVNLTRALYYYNQAANNCF